MANKSRDVKLVAEKVFASMEYRNRGVCLAVGRQSASIKRKDIYAKIVTERESASMLKFGVDVPTVVEKVFVHTELVRTTVFHVVDLQFVFMVEEGIIAVIVREQGYVPTKR